MSLLLPTLCLLNKFLLFIGGVNILHALFIGDELVAIHKIAAMIDMMQIIAHGYFLLDKGKKQW
ncbi:Uncharacterised protein [Kingella negevensis]|uniref:Uncharacterized protein n=1 Tax=Kingella negevensis TaxID=1522312 RepID=A0A238HJA6_9NEIS|nr:Uncharacterised protein [Kingella negevensis]